MTTIFALVLLSQSYAFSQSSDSSVGNVLCIANNEQNRTWFSTKAFSPGSGNSMEKDEGNYRILFHRGTDFNLEKKTEGATKIKITILPKGFTKLKFQKNSPPSYVPIHSKDGELNGGAHGLAVLTNVGDQVRFEFTVNGMPETVVTCKILDEEETNQYHNDPNKLLLLNLISPQRHGNPKVSESALKTDVSNAATAGKTKKTARPRAIGSH